MVYCISYDLNKDGKNYEGLIEELKKSSSWWHFLKSTWLIYTNETASQVWTRLEKQVDKDDYILIILVSKDYQGWLPKEAWEWIERYLK